MVDNSAANKDKERLIALAIQHFKVDVPVVAYREEGGTVVVFLLGGRELRCKFHDLMVSVPEAPLDERPTRPAPQRKPPAQRKPKPRVKPPVKKES